MTLPQVSRLLWDSTAARGCVPHPGLPMLASQVDPILDFLGLSVIANDSRSCLKRCFGAGFS